MLVARNLAYLSQVESTISYSRKLAALGRLSAGIAHEVKNPLNATMIHLELLRMQLADCRQRMEHVAVIAAQVRRLDEVVQGFLKFTRPEELQLQPVDIAPLVEELMPIISAEAEQARRGGAARIPRRPALGERRRRPAAAGLPEPGAQRVPGDAARRPPAHRAAATGAAASSSSSRTPARHPAGAPGADLRPVLHDEGTWQRDRPVDGLPHASSCTTADIEVRVDARTGHHVPGRAAPSLTAGARRGRAVGHNRRMRLAVILLAIGAVAGCTKVQAKVPPVPPALTTPAPPDRVIVPAPAPEPAEAPPAVTPAPPPPAPRPRETPASRPERPRPSTAPPAAAEPSPAPVLQTTSTAELEQQARLLIAAAERDLAQLTPARLSAAARAQYDTARSFLAQANEALKVKNVLLARELADKAAALSNQIAR